MDLPDPARDHPLDVGIALARAGEQDALRRHPRREGRRELGARGDLGPRAFLAEHPDHRRVRVRLHGIIDLREPRDRGAQIPVASPQDPGLVDEERRAVRLGERPEIEAARMDHAADPREAGRDQPV